MLASQGRNRRACRGTRRPCRHEAQLIVRVAVREIFVNCPRYVHKAVWVEDSPFVPKRGCETPIPDWKRKDSMLNALSAQDRARLEREKSGR